MNFSDIQETHKILENFIPVKMLTLGLKEPWKYEVKGCRHVKCEVKGCNILYMGLAAETGASPCYLSWERKNDSERRRVQWAESWTTWYSRVLTPSGICQTRFQIFLGLVVPFVCFPPFHFLPFWNNAYTYNYYPRSFPSFCLGADN